MRHNIFKLIIVAITLCFCFINNRTSLYAQNQSDEETGYVAGQVIVKFKPTLRASAQQIKEKKLRFQDYLTDQSDDSLDKVIKRLRVSRIEHLHSSGNDFLISARRTNSKKRLRQKFKKRFAAFSPQQIEKILSDLPNLDLIYLFHIPEESNVEEAVAFLQMNRHVEYAQPDYIMEFSSFEPEDPFYESSTNENLWGLENMGEDSSGNNKMGLVWDKVQGQGMVVAVVDIGVDIHHPDIAENIWENPGETGKDANGNDKSNNGIDDDGNGMDENGELIDWRQSMIDDVFGWDFINTDNSPQDEDGHGTHVAGTIVAVSNDIGILGVAPKAKIMAVRIGEDAPVSSVAFKGITYAAEQQADVINNSWGCGDCENEKLLKEAIELAHGLGSVVVFSAGNSNKDVQGATLKNMDEVIAVAAMDINNNTIIHSNFGELAIAAPGNGILSLNANGGDNAFVTARPETVSSKDSNYRYGSGTSMAAPHVSGLAALILQQTPLDGSMTPAERADFVKKKLFETSLKDVTGKEIGGGRVNALRAILGIPPEIEDIEDITVEVNEEAVFTVTATDVDDKNEDLVISVSLESGESIGTVGASFNDNGDGTGDFNFTATDDHSATTLFFLFEAKDPNGLADEETVLITVNETIPEIITPTIIKPDPETTLAVSSVTFQWDAVDGFSAYYLKVGTKGEGSNNVYRRYLGSKTSATVSRIPLNGQTIFVRLHFKKAGVWDSKDFSYTTINKNSIKTNRVIRKEQFFMIESK